jgi:hypothetical protein
MSIDDDRLARASRALRHRLGRSQDALVGTGRSRHIPRLIEDGRAGELRLQDVRGHFAKLGATVRISAWFEGALLDRLVDELHAEVVEAGTREMLGAGWPRVDAEVSFNEWGERGSIDLFGAHEARSAILIGEAKSAWGSLEETLRSIDVKVRLAPTIARKRLGWRPTSIGVVLVLPETGANRRVAQRHAATLLSAFPARNREIRSWLREPAGPLRGLWFLPLGRVRDQSTR